MWFLKLCAQMNIDPMSDDARSLARQVSKHERGRTQPKDLRDRKRKARKTAAQSRRRNRG